MGGYPCTTLKKHGSTPGEAGEGFFFNDLAIASSVFGHRMNQFLMQEREGGGMNGRKKEIDKEREDQI